MMNTPMGFGLGWLWMALVPLIVFGGIIWLFWSVGNQNDRNRQDGLNETGATQSAMSIVKQRYARGEINKEQFEEMRRSLET